MITETIAQKALDVINAYKNLQLNGKAIQTPYYINAPRRKDLRAMVGKGTPEEIKVETRIWEKLKGINLKNMSEDDIKQFLTDRGLGIDCSGFVAHVLNAWYKEIYGESIWRKLKPLRLSFMGPIVYWLRPAENLGAEILTNSENSIPIAINDIRPGDLIRSKAKRQNGHHIMLITEVTRDDSQPNTPVVSFKYTHASPYFGKHNGVKDGEIRIMDLTKPLQDQDWLETDENGVKHTLEGYLINVGDNGLRRLKCMQ